MTNLWSKSLKQIELWKAANSIFLSARTGRFSVVGVGVSFISPIILSASLGSFAVTGKSATLVYSASTGQATGLLMAITYP